MKPRYRGDDPTAEAAVARADKRSKYGAVRTEVDGIKFDSKAEARRYASLKMMEKSGYIKDLKVHPAFPIYVGKYIADFSYIEGRRMVVEDVKGVSTALFKYKAKIFKKDYPYIEFRVIPAKEV